MIVRPWWHVFREETPGDGTDAGGGATGEADAAGAAPAGGTPSEGEPSATASKDMLAAINAGLGYEKKDGDADPKGAKVPSAEEKAATQKAAEDTAKKDLEAKAAAGDAAAKAKLEEDRKTAEAASREAKKPKDLATLGLSDAEKKAMKQDTQRRFNDVLEIAKTERTRAEQAERVATELQAARDGLVQVLRESGTTDTDISNFVQFHQLYRSNDRRALEVALQVVDSQRTSLLKRLGRDAPGFDAIADFPDLVADVEDQLVTRERALELANARRAQAAETAKTEAERRASTQKGNAQAAFEKASTGALASIDDWTARTAATDLDFKAKEATILPRIEQIVRQYPPHLWLPTIKTVYESIAVPKSQPNADLGGHKPLRPSGAKPGAPAPTSMAEAIDQGLGYAKA